MSLAVDADRKVDARQSPPRRSSSDKAALEYLDLCGAVPISVIERDGTCTIRAGGDGLSAQWWVDRTKAVPVARAAAQGDPADRVKETLLSVTAGLRLPLSCAPELR
jgi:hypothetical protein